MLFIKRMHSYYIIACRLAKISMIISKSKSSEELFFHCVSRELIGLHIIQRYFELFRINLIFYLFFVLLEDFLSWKDKFVFLISFLQQISQVNLPFGTVVFMLKAHSLKCFLFNFFLEIKIRLFDLLLFFLLTIIFNIDNNLRRLHILLWIYFIYLPKKLLFIQTFFPIINHIHC